MIVKEIKRYPTYYYLLIDPNRPFRAGLPAPNGLELTNTPERVPQAPSTPNPHKQRKNCLH